MIAGIVVAWKGEGGNFREDYQSQHHLELGNGLSIGIVELGKIGDLEIVVRPEIVVETEIVVGIVVAVVIVVGIEIVVAVVIVIVAVAVVGTEIVVAVAFVDGNTVVIVVVTHLVEKENQTEVCSHLFFH